MSFTPSFRISAADPTVRVIGAVTSSISLADSAEYDLGDVTYGRYEVRFDKDERPVRGSFNVRPKADIAFSALSLTSNVVTATVTSGAGEGIQVGQWIKANPTATTANAALLRGWFKVTDTTATTIVWAQTHANVADVGAGVLQSDAVCFPEMQSPIVLWDSVVAADNQDSNLGALRAGRYEVQFLDTTTKAGIIFSDGTTMTEYIANLDDVTDGDTYTNAAVKDATSNTVTALFVSGGDVILRNGADVAAKIRVTFHPGGFTGLDQDGSVNFYAKEGTLRLKNELGATTVFELARLA